MASPPAALMLRDDLVEPGLPAPCGDHLRPLTAQRQSARPADAAARPGDEADAVLEAGLASHSSISIRVRGSLNNSRIFPDARLSKVAN